MQRSNGYVIGFIVAMTVLCAGALAGVSELLTAKIAIQRSLDTKKKILSTVMDSDVFASKSDEELEADYANFVQGIVVYYDGTVLEGVDAENISPRNEFKKKEVMDKLFPVFIFTKDNEKRYVLPIYGLGLWDEVWGYIAIKEDGNTVGGVVLDHKQETPGLGARISDREVQNRFVGKKVFDASGKVMLRFLKSEGNKDLDDTTVDGISGSTITTAGVNAMFSHYMGYYEPYLKNLKN